MNRLRSLKKYTIDDMHKIAEGRGGKCLSKEYSGMLNKLDWQCSLGHIWSTKPSHVVHDRSWCRECGNLKRRRKCDKKTRQKAKQKIGNAKNNEEKLKMCQDIAKSRGGICVSDKYIRSCDGLEWRCDKNHFWEATPTNVINHGSWCPHCIGRIVTIEDIQLIAHERGGKCLSKSYVNARTKMEFLCAYEHIFWTTSNALKNGQWCSHRKCINKKFLEKIDQYSIEEIRQFVESKGGVLLSKSYKNMNNKLDFRCSKGHEWKTAVGHVVYNQTWCSICDYLDNPHNKKFSLEDARKSCKKQGFTCLSKTYNSTQSKLKIQCNRCGHVYKKIGFQVIHGIGKCPLCSRNMTEGKCRFILENMTGLLWPSNNSKINPYQLDMFNELHNVAFEYNGEQHDKYTPLFHHNKGKGLAHQIERDRKKLQRCQEIGIKLIIISWRTNEKGNSELIKFIKSSLNNLGIKIVCENINVDDFYENYSYCQDQLKIIQNIAESKNGKCLSIYYKYSTIKLEFQCDKKHKWWATPSKIKRGTWCRKCSGTNSRKLDWDKAESMYLNGNSSKNIARKMKCDKKSIMYILKKKGYE